jgi:hypothetical protein
MSFIMADELAREYSPPHCLNQEMAQKNQKKICFQQQQRQQNILQMRHGVDCTTFQPILLWHQWQTVSTESHFDMHVRMTIWKLGDLSGIKQLNISITARLPTVALHASP